MAGVSKFLTSSSRSRRLVVILHSYNGTTSSVRDVSRTIRGCFTDHAESVEDTFAEADILIPAMPAGLLSFARVEDITKQVIGEVTAAWDKNGGYEDITFIGHSLGGLIARHAYIVACGDHDRAPRPKEDGRDEEHSETSLRHGRKKPLDWADKVSRIVLLAGMNRGWRLSHHLSITTALMWVPGVILIQLLQLFGLTPLIAQIRKGAPFITNLRLQWLWMRQWARQPGDYPGAALTIQLLGSVDDMVSPEDNIDLVAGSDFVYLDVPFSGHANVIEMGTSASGSRPVPDAAPDGPQTMGEARRAVLAKALTWSRERLRDVEIIPSDEMPFDQDNSVTDVVFVIHGIRDKGYWTHKVARRVVELAKREKRKARVATETSSYGYFPIAEFLRPAGRRSKVEWLMDQYGEAVARYPNASFSYIGHSNGTYLLAKALASYPLCRFENVVFAGSVVSRRFDWSARPDQVKRLLNIRATADWVVAFFPKAFQDLRLQDIGSAGHNGFTPGQHIVVAQPICRGAHGAALVEQNWDAIATFALLGRTPKIPDSIDGKNLSPVAAGSKTLVHVVGSVAPLVWVILAVGACAIGWWIWSLPYAEWLRTVLLATYVWLLVKLAHVA
ncbi:hypothetical protein [uncultured Roseobacter sp.]|uniref:alpha/beta hydrolase n=1 Tax=uncultured Roseobacter sp. TaxID=114847 RepID=UPI00262C98C5|nr:hypothetical protein [uncultured Roseobacter sp.]